MKALAFATAASMLILAGSNALAQDISGNYSVSGTTFDGTPYSSTVDLRATSAGTCDFIRDGRTNELSECLWSGDFLATSWVEDNAVGLSIYQLQADGSFKGTWTLSGKSGVGRETMTPE